MADEKKTRKKPKRKPTLKQKEAFVKYIEFHGNAYKAMRAAGYTHASALNAKNLTESSGFQALAEEVLPDNLLLKVHKEGLQASKVISAIITGKDADGGTNDFIEVPDHPTRHKFLETAYKIKNKIQPQQPQGPNVIVPIQIVNEDREKYK